MEDITEKQNQNGEMIQSLQGMYQDYFLDYASYVILERAIPVLEDGLKPVQRRILHSMFEKEDGRYHKVANIIGNTMQYHPHGDAAIGDALVKLGQKDLLIDTQGNWGDVRTGDGAAASRYIEARLTKFALSVLFNKHITEWQLSYDGRKNEPIHLPVKFPLLITQGVEGIAVGLSTKIMPHNFVEIVKASIQVLKGKRFKLYPDFDTGGFMDVGNYQDGKKGGRLSVRAKIEKVDKQTLKITELPYGVTTGTLIDSVVKAADKGKIKIKRIVDNTAKDVEIEITLASGVSPDLTIDALYAFSNCEVSIAPNACVIVNNKPMFLTISELLRLSTEHTRELLRQELEFDLHQLHEKWHNASLEKIFIENRVYREIEEAESWEEVVSTIDHEMRKYIRTPNEAVSANDTRTLLNREFTEEDINHLTEIKIRRISKYNSFKAEENLRKLEDQIAEKNHHLNHLTDYAINHFEDILQKFGTGHERKTKITSFEDINLAEVAANNVKCYVQRKEGFIGWGLKKDEFVTECSDLDDIITFRKDGQFSVVKIGEKTFVGKQILHANVWRKGDQRTTYHLVYLDGKSGKAMVKRFQVQAITREKNYDLTTGAKGSKVLYFSVHPNAESEIIKIQLTPGSKARKKVFEFDFASIDIKGRSAKGNILTKYPVKQISQVSVGESSLGPMKLWMDESSGRINAEERGVYLGAFDQKDRIVAFYKQGNYIEYASEVNKKIEVNQLLTVLKIREGDIISCVYYDGNKKWSIVKRFQLETNSLGQSFQLIGDHVKSKLLFITTEIGVTIRYANAAKIVKEVSLDAFIDVKGWKSLGNKLEEGLVKSIEKIQSVIKPGETIEFEVDNDKGQANLFD